MIKVLDEIADSLDKADREGADKDTPEGARYIIMSDTLARQIAETMRQVSQESENTP